MGSTELKPHLFNELKMVRGTDEFEVYLFTPSLIKAFPIKLENISLANRVRYLIEFFVGYKIYYIQKNGNWAGYCIVSNGRNFRYSFSDNDDMIFGRYYIKPEYRGQGLGVKMLRRVLDRSDLDYKKAFAYVHKGNKSSHEVVLKLGCHKVGHLKKMGKTRKITVCEDGEYTLYCYE